MYKDLMNKNHIIFFLLETVTFETTTSKRYGLKVVEVKKIQINLI